MANGNSESHGNTFHVYITVSLFQLLLKITPSSGPELYAYASQNGQTVNLTPMTNTAMFLAFGKNDLNTLYENWDGTGVTKAAVDAGEATVRANLEAQLKAQGIDAADFNLFTSAFSADGTGVDAVMDDLKVILDSSAGTVTFTDANDVDMNFDETIEPLAPLAPAGSISILTVTGKQHVLTGKYISACYDSPNGRLDSVIITGTTWVTSSEIFAGDDTCTGNPSSTGVITATMTKGADKNISGWKDQGDVAPAKADGNGDDLLDNERVTTFSITVTAVDDPTAVFGGNVTPGFVAPSAFYVFDDSASPNFTMYRDDDGAFASGSDPFIRR